NIPIIGFSDPVLSYFSALKNVTHAKNMLTTGYALDKRGMFKAPGWHVYICGPKLIEELCRLPDNTLDIQAAAKITLQGDYTFSPSIFSNGYHIPIIRHDLTRVLPAIFPAVVNELKVAFEEYVPCPASGEWISVKALDSLMRIICRASNTTFVGLPLCRNKEYMDVMLKYTIDVVLGAHIIGLFPKFLRPFAGRFVSNTRRRYNTAKKHISPVIEERYRKLEEHNGDWTCLPNDMLSWHMQAAEGVEKTPESLTYRILMLNFVSLHTVNTWVLFHIAAYPEYVPELRDEMDQVLEGSEWTCAAMNSLQKLDSFIKEVLRVKPVIGANITRLALRAFTLSNGTYIPAGTKISAAADPQHFDPEIFGENAAEFDGFRFIKLQDVGSVSQRLATSTSDYVGFGYGRHICPGRHFAVHEIKALVCHVLMNYDLKFVNSKFKHGQVPDAIWVGTMCALDPNVELMFKRREFKQFLQINYSSFAKWTWTVCKIQYSQL
ncbi:hypothetical protein PILCRDRAFT_69319, partial [Piloderma croceum F 1598]